jgi:predicted  nucleic acid-binding Zn-ribbon protein
MELTRLHDLNDNLSQQLESQLHEVIHDQPPPSHSLAPLALQKEELSQSFEILNVETQKWKEEATEVQLSLKDTRERYTVLHEDVR